MVLQLIYFFENNQVVDCKLFESKRQNVFKKKEEKEIVIDNSVHRESSGKRRKKLEKTKLPIKNQFSIAIVGIDPGNKTLITAYGLFETTANVKLITSNKVDNCDKTVEELLKLKFPLLNYAPHQYSYSSKQYYHDKNF